MGTAAGVTNFCGLHANVHGTIRRVVRGVADELLDRMRALDGLNEPHLIFGKMKAQAYDTPAFKCAADAMLLSAGAEILFHAVAVGVAMAEDGRIDALLVETRSGRFALRATTFIDCSGDGDLAHFAGVAMQPGGPLLFPTLMFRVGDVDPARAGEAWRTIPALMDEAEGAGDFRFPRKGAIVRPQRHASEWRVNVTQLKNTEQLRRRPHRRAFALAPARSRAGARRSTTSASCARACPASSAPTRSISPRRSASARRAASSASMS